MDRTAPPAPTLARVLDAPRAAAALASMLCADDAARLQQASWALWRGVVGIGRRAPPLALVAFRANGFGPATRARSWLACLRPAPHEDLLASFETPRPASARCSTSRSGGGGVATGLLGEIDRDVCRTFPHHPLFAAPADGGAAGGGGDAPSGLLAAHGGPELLRRVLRAFVRAHPDVGYCQGMNYVAAALLVTLEPCAHARAHGARAPPPAAATLPPASSSSSSAVDDRRVDVCLRLMSGLATQYGLDDVWRPGLPRVPGLAFVLSNLLRAHTPLLHEHLLRVGFDASALAAQWLLPLLSTALPFCSLRRVWDLFLATGWKALLRVLVALLARVEHRLLGLDVGGVSGFFRAWKDAVGRGRCDGSGGDDGGAAARLLGPFPEMALIYQPGALCAAALRVKVTRRHLAAAEAKYALRVIFSKVAAGLGASELPPRMLAVQRSLRVETLLAASAGAVPPAAAPTPGGGPSGSGGGGAAGHAAQTGGFAPLQAHTQAQAQQPLLLYPHGPPPASRSDDAGSSGQVARDVPATSPALASEQWAAFELALLAPMPTASSGGAGRLFFDRLPSVVAYKALRARARHARPQVRVGDEAPRGPGGAESASLHSGRRADTACSSARSEDAAAAAHAMPQPTQGSSSGDAGAAGRGGAPRLVLGSGTPRQAAAAAGAAADASVAPPTRAVASAAPAPSSSSSRGSLLLLPGGSRRGIFGGGFGRTSDGGGGGGGGGGGTTMGGLVNAVRARAAGAATGGAAPSSSPSSAAFAPASEAPAAAVVAAAAAAHAASTTAAVTAREDGRGSLRRGVGGGLGAAGGGAAAAHAAGGMPPIASTLSLARQFAVGAQADAEPRMLYVVPEEAPINTAPGAGALGGGGGVMGDLAAAATASAAMLVGVLVPSMPPVPALKWTPGASPPPQATQLQLAQMLQQQQQHAMGVVAPEHLSASLESLRKRLNFDVVGGSGGGASWGGAGSSSSSSGGGGGDGGQQLGSLSSRAGLGALVRGSRRAPSQQQQQLLQLGSSPVSSSFSPRRELEAAATVVSRGAAAAATATAFSAATPRPRLESARSAPDAGPGGGAGAALRLQTPPPPPPALGATPAPGASPAARHWWERLPLAAPRHAAGSASGGGGAPTRLDTLPYFPPLLHALATDLAAIDATTAEDVAVLTAKAGAAKAAVIAARASAERTRDALAGDEARMAAALASKRAGAVRVHALLTGIPETADLEGAYAASLQRPPPPLAAAAVLAGGELAAPLAPPLSPTPAAGDAAAAPPLAGARQPPASKHDVARASALLSRLDDDVHAAAGAFKRSVWEHTLAATRCSELAEVEAAIMGQLVALSTSRADEKRALALRLWAGLAALAAGAGGEDEDEGDALGLDAGEAGGSCVQLN